MLCQAILVLSLVSCCSIGVHSIEAREYKGNKFKGTIESVSNAELTLRDADNELTEFAVLPQTTYMRDEERVRLTDLQREDIAVITTVREASRLIALSVFAMEPE